MDKAMVKFYYMYRDFKGHVHHTIAAYQHANGIVWTMRDYIFDSMA